ncbi:hypothetical protein EDC04DRAFT_87255 [Pisolithus marmoratus]|nr:hypothetical protein EDC04DRAFT_87255 [Pisolithus marmoratus]
MCFFFLFLLSALSPGPLYTGNPLIHHPLPNSLQLPCAAPILSYIKLSAEETLCPHITTMSRPTSGNLHNRMDRMHGGCNLARHHNAGHPMENRVSSYSTSNDRLKLQCHGWKRSLTYHVGRSISARRKQCDSY